MICGRVDVDRMLDEITPQQMNEWMAYNSIEPFGDERDDMRHAFHTAAQISMNGFCDKPVEPSSFLNYIDDGAGSEPAMMTPNEAAAAMRAFGGG